MEVSKSQGEFFEKNEMTSDNHNKFKILLKQWITTTESVVVIPKRN